MKELNTQELLQYFINYSHMSKSIIGKIGSVNTFEMLYTKNVFTHIDNYYINSIAGNQIYKRMMAIESHIPQYLSDYSKNNELLIDNIGSGSGREMINILKKHTSLISQVKIRNIDPDPEAIAISRYLADCNKLSNCFEHIPDKFENVENRNVDIILLIGMLCPLSISLSKKIISKLYSFLKIGGLLIYSTALNKMCYDDPFLDFLMRYHGWNMSYKTVDESILIATSSGFELINVFFDEPYHHHSIIICKKIQKN
ncbi:MAG: class I SAM-dependent methyltransferase [Candidatus Cloacimonetes bacterium]|nr:class I SAM-dependent methyltransferase [Candidatus Cloacimonadota bacterium]